MRNCALHVVSMAVDCIVKLMDICLVNLITRNTRRKMLYIFKMPFDFELLLLSLHLVGYSVTELQN